MKNLDSFISEESKKKEKAHATKKGGADDKKYVTMMEEYKRLRRTDREAANDLLKKARKLAKEGDVSKNAKIAGAYI